MYMTPLTVGLSTRSRYGMRFASPVFVARRAIPQDIAAQPPQAGAHSRAQPGPPYSTSPPSTAAAVAKTAPLAGPRTSWLNCGVGSAFVCLGLLFNEFFIRHGLGVGQVGWIARAGIYLASVVMIG